MTRTLWSLSLLTAALAGLPLRADDPPPPSQPVLGVIKGPSREQARALTLQWLTDVKASPEAVKKVEALWQSAGEQPLLDCVAESFALADPEAQAVIAQSRHGAAAAGELPPLLRDTSRGPFFRANLGLYVAKHLANRRQHEEALDAIRGVRAEQVVDPASYYFYKGVCENKLRLRDEGLQTIERLLHSIPDAPERYLVVAALMKTEMESWKEKDLGDISRRMEEIEGRLGNARGGPKTQEKQKEVIALLDQMIEEIEQQMQQQQQQQSSGQNQRAERSDRPLPDSRILGGQGEGRVDNRRLIQNLELWGKLPEKEKIRALEAISREYPPHVREAIEGYLRSINKQSGGN